MLNFSGLDFFAGKFCGQTSLWPIRLIQLTFSEPNCMPRPLYAFESHSHSTEISYFIEKLERELLYDLAILLSLYPKQLKAEGTTGRMTPSTQFVCWSPNPNTSDRNWRQGL